MNGGEISQLQGRVSYLAQDLRARLRYGYGSRSSPLGSNIIVRTGAGGTNGEFQYGRENTQTPLIELVRGCERKEIHRGRV